MYFVGLFIGILLIAGSVHAQPAVYRTLLEKSPFGQPASTDRPTSAPAGGPEFCGYSAENDEFLFALSWRSPDGGTRTEWLRLRESFRGARIVAFDETRACLTVENADAVTVLPLKCAATRFVNEAFDSNPETGPAPTWEERRRIEDIVKQIERSRSLRKAAGAGTSKAS